MSNKRVNVLLIKEHGGDKVVKLINNAMLDDIITIDEFDEIKKSNEAVGIVFIKK